jgi:hypothetical protein
MRKRSALLNLRQQANALIHPIAIAFSWLGSVCRGNLETIHVDEESAIRTDGTPFRSSSVRYARFSERCITSELGGDRPPTRLRHIWCLTFW